MKRYNISTTVHGDACLQQWYNGKIVLYEDHEKSIAALRAKLKQAEEERDDRRMSLAQEIAGLLKARGLYCPKDFNSPDIIQAVGLALESLSEHRLNFDLAREAEKRGEEMFLEAHPEYRERLALPGTDRLVCWLLEQLTAYESRDETWRGKKEMLENDLAKAWEKLERYERAMGPVVKMKRWMRKIGNWPIAGPERDYTIKNRNSEAWEACKNATRLLDSGKVTESGRGS